MIIMKLIDNKRGYKEIIIIDDCEFEVFYSFSDSLRKKLSIKYINQIDDFDTVFLGFEFKNSFFTLSYNVFLGISIHPEKVELASEINNQILVEIFSLINN